MSKWMVPLSTAKQPVGRIICFPHAGGTPAAFARFRERCPVDVDLLGVCLPGRLWRYKEPPAKDLATLVHAMVDALLPAMVPYAFFGHSVGALFCFEVTRELQRRQAPLPALIVISAHRAPHLPVRSPLSALSDNDLLEMCVPKTSGLTPVQARNIVLHQLRADLILGEHYIYVPDKTVPLLCPILALGGTQDTLVSAAELEAWRGYTQQTFSLHLYTGDHFYAYSEEHAQAIMRMLSALSSKCPPIGEGN